MTDMLRTFVGLSREYISNWPRLKAYRWKEHIDLPMSARISSIVKLFGEHRSASSSWYTVLLFWSYLRGGVCHQIFATFAASPATQ